jgi:hypothetical protein
VGLYGKKIVDPLADSFHPPPGGSSSYSLSRAKKKRDCIQASNGLRYETIKVKRRGRRWCITDLSYLRSFSVHKRGFAVEVPHKQ